MKLLFKQRFFSWFDSYDIYFENGTLAFTVQGQLSWGHKLHILGPNGAHVATVKQVVFAFMPCFELYVGDKYYGRIRRKFTFLKPSYYFDFNDWRVEGNFWEWDYNIMSGSGLIATVSKQLFNFTDTYVIDIVDPKDALLSLMFTLAIDAEKCSRNS